MNQSDDGLANHEEFGCLDLGVILYMGQAQPFAARIQNTKYLLQASLSFLYF